MNLKLNTQTKRFQKNARKKSQDKVSQKKLLRG